MQPQVCGYKEYKFFKNGEKFSVRDSSWSKFPTTAEPFNKYKYVSFSVVRNPDFRQIFMTTNGIFDVLSEIGGLTRAVFAIGKIFVNPFSIFALQAQLAKVLIKLMPSTRSTKNKKKVSEKTRREAFMLKYC